jgi:peptidoglycan/LPS O-acetylase OafA/YrhL
MITAKRTHIYWLDALKFISMIVVFLCHFRMAFLYDKFRSIDFNGVLFPNYFFNGNLAVCMFLLISCYLFVLKAQKAENESNMDYRLVKKRFFRLWIPAVVVNLLIFVLYASHFFFNKGAYDESVPYVNDWFSFSSTVKAFGAMLWADANTCLFSNGTNPPLWCYYLLFFLPLIAYWSIKTIKGNDILIVSLLILPLLCLHNSYFAVVPLSIIIHKLSEC